MSRMVQKQIVRHMNLKLILQTKFKSPANIHILELKNLFLE